MNYATTSDHHHRSFISDHLRHRQHHQNTCSQNHTSSLILETIEGGSICLICLSNLITNPNSPTVHVSYALSQLSIAISQPQFLNNLITFHPHFLVSPLVTAICSFDDEALAKQIIDLIGELCRSDGGCEIYGEFVARVSDRLCSGSLAWSRRQIYMLHCLGVLLDYQKNDSYTYIKDRDALYLNLVTGLQLPSEEIQGEILFLLYKICSIQHEYVGSNNGDLLCGHSSKILRLSLEALLKTHRDDVRMNCVALLSVLARRGFFENALENEKEYLEADNFMETTEHELEKTPLNLLFAEAIKSPLLSSDSEVQTATLDLIVLYLSGGVTEKEVQVLVEENIADYIFEILRLYGCKKDSVVTSSLQALDLLSAAEVAFKQRLAVGFSTLVPVLRYVAEVPFHPAQCQSLKLVSECLSNCPGIISSLNIEEISIIMTAVLKKHIDGEANMLPETFTLVCTVLVALMKSPSSHGTLSIAKSLQDASRYTIGICLSYYGEYCGQVLDSLYLLKEAYEYSFEGNPTDSNYLGLRNCILDICETKLLPWVSTSINEINGDIVLGVLEIFHSLLIQSDFHPKKFVGVLVSSSWFSFSFGCLGLFPTEKMKWRVYFLLSSILDMLLGNDSGQPIRDVTLHLPSDPMDLLYLLGQKGSYNQEVFGCQSAVLLILYASSLYDDRLADDRMVLASLEQYILLNNSEIFGGVVEPLTMAVLINLYGLYRGLAKISYQIPYSLETESTLFNLMAEKQYEFLSIRIHMRALKWFFQQERICEYISGQILRWCRRCIVYGNQIVASNNTETVNFKELAELVASGDNYGAKLLVCLLGELVEENGHENDIILLINMISEIIALYPAASEQLCLNGIALAIQNLYQHFSYSAEIFNVTSQLAFTILHSAPSESLSDDELWVTVATELMHYILSSIAEIGCSQEALLVMGIFSLILYHSLHQNLVEASKTILLNTQWISLVNKMIHEACLKGPALFDHDEATQTGEGIIFLLLLNFFCLRSVQAVLPGIEDAQNLLDGETRNQLSSFYISIHCHDLCRLLHFGSTSVKLVSSYCLLELLQRITEQKRKEPDKVKQNAHHILSITSVLQGLIFHSDIRIAMNCALCIVMTMDWETQVEKDNWYRLITEELVTILAVPGLTSKSIMIHHKPAVYIAVSLLKLQHVPPWMSTLFDDSCISGIIQNLSPTNVTREMVLLFRELLRSGLLNSNQIACLNQIFQACRKRVYSNGNTEDKEKMLVFPHDLEKVYDVLINLISPESSSNDGLLEEIDLFCQTPMEAE
uniref:protein PUTATIVE RECOMBINATION INITIATION DEFECT 1 n=1 Tax=Erigeron canadensis TaxID=72917 RepID=UPI001CB90A6B|nr:protein PUTATIVE RECOMBINATION INITIATION DEFECT 1 [Erigeron canadensis]